MKVHVGLTQGLHSLRTRSASFFLYLLLEFALEEMDFEPLTVVVLGSRLVLAGVRIKLLFHLVDLSDILEFVCLESVHNLLTDSAGSRFHVDVTLNQSSKSVMVRAFLFDLRLVNWLFLLLFLFFNFFAGCDLEGILNLLFETLLESIDDFVYMQFSFRLLKGVFFIAGLGEGCLSVNFVLLGCDALILD